MNRIDFNFNAMAQRSLKEVGKILVRQGRINMDTVSYGRVYITPKGKHIASKKGDPANNMTGELRKTIRFKVRGNELEFGAGNKKIRYAKWLEASMDRPNIAQAIGQSKKPLMVVLEKFFWDALKVT